MVQIECSRLDPCAVFEHTLGTLMIEQIKANWEIVAFCLTGGSAFAYKLTTMLWDASKNIQRATDKLDAMDAAQQKIKADVDTLREKQAEHGTRIAVAETHIHHLRQPSDDHDTDKVKMIRPAL